MTPRIEPVQPPYPPELQKVLDSIMPPGVPPLALFTTLARVPRIWDRFRAGSLLDRGPVSLRHREIVIDRTCARCGCEYEWGVHVAFFAQRVGLSNEQIASLTYGKATDACWTDERDRLLIEAVDSLHDASRIDDSLWDRLAATLADDELLDLLMLTGWYHTISFTANGVELDPEDGAPRFADVR